MKIIEEKRIFVVYEIGLFLKALQAFLEIVAGVLFYFISTNAITTFVLTIAHGELTEMPRDFMSNLLMSGVTQLSAASKFFIVFYLLSHGIIKLGIIFGLYFKKKWSFPVAVIGFGGLLLYEIYCVIVSYSLSLSLFILMDVIILWLVVREHYVPKRYLKP